MEELSDNRPSEESNDGMVDEAMLEMGDFLSQMTDVDGYLADTEMRTSMKVEKLNMSMPIQLDLLVMDDGSIVLGASPPLYYTETTFLPVFHQLTINIDVEEKENRKNDGRSKQRMES
jgi:hypothetical protein